LLKDRWVLGFTAGALALVILAILTVSLAGGRQAIDYPEETPVGVVQRYLLALEDGRVEAAREYRGGSVRGDGRRPEIPFRASPEGVRRIVLVSETIEAETAVVVVEISTVYQSNDIQSSASSNLVTFELHLVKGVWKIMSPTYFPF
jgi:hypothetical protein